MPGVLYVVATPIGNLEDVTLRALRVLADVDLIAAEDTRRTRTLLERHGIRRPVTSYYDAVERERAPALVERLKEGQSIALVSDAGTPHVSDPGYHLVRGALAAGVAVVPIPGPSAVTDARLGRGLPRRALRVRGLPPDARRRRAPRASRRSRRSRARSCSSRRHAGWTRSSPRPWRRSAPSARRSSRAS
jgi:16S rRNA (cytidine1402-2'-O)-methyltransferase